MIKDDIEKFMSEIKKEMKKMIIGFEPTNPDFPDLKAEFNKEDK